MTSGMSVGRTTRLSSHGGAATMKAGPSTDPAASSSLEELIAQHRTRQLGLYTTLSPLPQPLLTSDLDALQAALSATLEQQRQQAEQQVQDAITRLDADWAKVADWRNALGEKPQPSNSRNEATAATTPLLVQLDQVERVLQGMRSRMQARGEAILQTQRRLKLEYVPLLGLDFVTVKIEEVVGADQVDAGDWETLQDLSLDRLTELERQLMTCETELAHRRETVHVHVNEIFALRAELGIHQASRASMPMPTPTSTSSQVRVPEADALDEAILCHLGVGDDRQKVQLAPTTENIARLQAKRQWLEEEKASRNATIQATYDKLYPLWTMLGVSEQEMEDFVNCWMGSTTDVVNAYESELARMLTLKRSNLAAFITRERELLSVLWDALYLSPAQRLASFAPYAINVQPTLVWNEALGQEDEIINDNVSEELLVAHERERERLEAEVERSQPVLERLAKYFAVVDEMAQLEASAADPSRLLGKSTRGDPGRLLREEKARKRVQKEKPKLEMELRQFIPQWEHEQGRQFEVNGVRFLDELEERMGKEAAEKESKKRTKLGASMSGTSTRTAPLRAQPTGATTTGGSMAPLKRQMTGRSTTSSNATGTSTGPSAPKRQAAMATGGGVEHGRSRAVLGDYGNTYHSRPVKTQMTGHRAVSKSAVVPQATGTTSHRSAAGAGVGAGMPGHIEQQPTGMRLPAGWGAATAAVTAANVAHLPGGFAPGGVQHAAVGGMAGFRPRPSTTGPVGLYGPPR